MVIINLSNTNIDIPYLCLQNLQPDLALRPKLGPDSPVPAGWNAKGSEQTSDPFGVDSGGYRVYVMLTFT